jgi:hypothetical protein
MKAAKIIFWADFSVVKAANKCEQYYDVGDNDTIFLSVFIEVKTLLKEAESTSLQANLTFLYRYFSSISSKF